MKKPFIIALTLTAFLSAWPFQADAQWVQTNGPYGGNVYAFAVSGTNLFAGTDRGVFLSTNNGASWTAVNAGLTYPYVRAFAASGTNLFAGTDRGVFLSTDSGASWSPVNTGLTYSVVLALAVSGTNLFAGTSGDGVFLSTNNGTSWSAAGLTSTDIRSFAVSGTNLFAGTWGVGVFLSTNSGTSWSKTGLTNSYVNALAVSGTNLFAGTDDGSVWRRPLSEMVISAPAAPTLLTPANAATGVPVRTGFSWTASRPGPRRTDFRWPRTPFSRVWW